MHHDKLRAFDMELAELLQPPTWSFDFILGSTFSEYWMDALITNNFGYRRQKDIYDVEGPVLSFVANM